MAEKFQIKFLVQLLLVGTSSSQGTGSSTSSTRPHLVFLLADDQGHNNTVINNLALIGDETRKMVAEGIRLDRHYVFKFCSPTRCSFLSGRWPIHVNQENSATEQRFAGVPLNMTTVSEKLNAAGYICHHFGKWHAGQATLAHTPYGRGFSTSLSFFNFGEDHFTQIRGGQAMSGNGFFEQRETMSNDEDVACQHQGVDLWNHTTPAHGQNGTYGGFLFTQAAVDAINAHDMSQPFFMFVAFQNIHPPLEVPQSYIDKYTDPSMKLTVNGMATFLDESMGNITAALKLKKMWNNTLVIFSADKSVFQTWALRMVSNVPLR